MPDSVQKAPTEAARPPGGTQAVLRAIRLLKTVAQSPDPLSLNDLSKSLRLSKSTAHRILSALISEGMVQQDPVTRLFAAGQESLSLSANAIRHHDLRSLALPVLEKLTLLSGETATMEIPIGTEMLILAEVLSSRLVGAHVEIGTRWPMHATSSGKITLSMMNPEHLSICLEHPRKTFTNKTVVSKKRLLKDLERIRTDGFAVVEGELQTTFSAVSAAIRDEIGQAMATLSIGGPSDRLPRKTLNRLGIILVDEVLKLENPAQICSA